MTRVIDAVDHVGVAVRSLADAAPRYEAMGFLLTPFSLQAGATTSGEAVRPLGSGNRCVMFADDYLEILANADPAMPSERLAGFLRHHEGAHILCFRTSAPQALDQRLRVAGVTTSGVTPLQRDVATDAGTRTARFERVQFSPQDSAEGYIQAVRHLTPEYLHQPRYLRHPNGCTGLGNVSMIVDDLAGYVARYEAYTGMRARSDGDAATFAFAQGPKLTLLTPRRARVVLPGTLWPPVPGIAAVGFRCPGLAAQRRRLQHAGLHVIKADAGLIVPAEVAHGVALVFEDGE